VVGQILAMANLVADALTRTSKSQKGDGVYVVQNCYEDSDHRQQGKGSHTTHYNERDESIPVSNKYQSKRGRLGSTPRDLLRHWAVHISFNSVLSLAFNG
jgi:hypothetical protein